MRGDEQVIRIVRADYRDPAQGQALVDLLDAYAQDEMGGAEPLTPEVRQTLVARLAELPHALTLLAYVGNTPVGLLNAFMGFSTFKAQPLFNVHDVAVLADWRGRGVGRRLLQALEDEARVRGCCKITLEVLSGNAPAMGAYRKQGYAPYDLGEEHGQAQFWQKWL